MKKKNDKKCLHNGEGDKIDTPVVSIKNLPEFVTNLLDEYEENSRLTWHGQKIPNDEIWLKLGSDNGGGSFKLILQVASLPNPNSKHNTFLVAIVNTTDRPENLRRVLNPYKEQVDELQKKKNGERKKKTAHLLIRRL